MPSGLSRRALLGAAAVGLSVSRAVQAQSTFPARPIRIVHGYSAASNPDTIARVIAPGLSEALGQSVIVEPKPGAGERIGAQYVIGQPADGYTLYLITGGANVISATDPQAPFSTLKDFTYISTLTLFPFALFVGTNSPLKTFPDLLDLARREPGKHNYGHSGVGNTLHLAVEYLKAKAGVSIEPVAYKDTAQQISDVVNGRLDVAIGTFTGYHGALANSQVRILAVTSRERWPQNPDVPPVSDFVADYEVVSWLGLVAPAGLPADVTDRLAAAVKFTIARPEVHSRLQAMGNDARASTPAQFRARVEADHAKWKPLAKLVNP
jgi:tripartite-type tricarboxylate transporter receptor subunit TctC